MRLGGIVLCGGESSRMGRPKAWLPIGPHLMLPWVVSRVQEAVGPIVVVAGLGQEVPPLPETVRVIRDRETGQGPLQGIEAGLAALTGMCDAAYVSSCDVPYLKPTFIVRMATLLGENDIAVPFVEARYHPLASVLRVDVSATARRLIDAGRRKVMLLLEECRTRAVSAEELMDVDPVLDSLRNVNTPEEYEQALRDF